VRVVVIAEWYPSPADPVLGIWAHRQAVAARDAGAEVRVLALRRPIPPLRTLRALAAAPPDPRPLAGWARSLRSQLSPFALDGIEVGTVPFLAPPRPRSYSRWGRWMAPPLGRVLARLAREFRPDVVHAHNVLPTGDALRRARGAAGDAALVVSTHGPDVIHVAGAGAAAARATTATLTGADLVIANSRWAERRCAELAGGPLASAVVHLGADLPSAAPPRRERPTVVTVGHLVARKRHAVVLHALAAVRGRLELDYVVIGDGPGREPLERLARELGLERSVTFAGQLAHPDALAEAASCHVFAMPSVEEPFGVAYVEAMAAGLPAVGVRGEGGPEDIAAAGGGMTLVPPDDHGAVADALERLFGEGPERAGAEARANVERNFTWRRCGEATVAAYGRALETRRRR
jgi:glycosyltransferase involved in cell wall biosynthesis